MFSEIQRVYSEPWSISTKQFLKYSVSSLACATLAKRMWGTANQLVEEPHAREAVFRAGQRLFSLAAEQRDATVDHFATANRVGSIAIGLFSAAMAIKAIILVWNRKRQELR